MIKPSKLKAYTKTLRLKNLENRLKEAAKLGFTSIYGNINADEATLFEKLGYKVTVKPYTSEFIQNESYFEISWP